MNDKFIHTIRISGKERKERVRTILYDLAHFRNMLIILIRRYKELNGKYPLNQSILYGLLSKEYKGKYQNEYAELLINIEKDSQLQGLYESLRIQKERIDNPHFIQYLIRQTIKDFNSFFRTMKTYKEEKSKFKGLPKPPKTKKLKDIISFAIEGNVNTFKQEKEYLVIRLRENTYLKVKLPKELIDIRVSSIRLKFIGNDLYVDLVYENFKLIEQPIGNYKVGIDIGLDEMLSVVSDNPNLKSFIVSGKEIKSFNQWFNKEKAKLQSEIDNLNNLIKKGFSEYTNKVNQLQYKLKSLFAYRYRWIHNNFHKISRQLVNILHKTGHNAIYIGKNALESKNGIDLGSKTNQNFVSIPYRKLIDMIKYKAQQLGMEVIEVDEAYTSKSSPFSDIMVIQKTYNKTLCNGERKGNVFRDFASDKVFHADLVGALNILRIGVREKVLSFYENLKVVFIKLCNPIKLSLIDFIYKVSPESLWIGSSSLFGWMGKSNFLWNTCQVIEFET